MKAGHLQTPIAYLKGVGPHRAEHLKKELGVAVYQDLLHLFPYRYIDKTRYYKIAQLERNSAEVQIIGKIVHLKSVDQKRGKRLVARFADDTGEMELVWFRGQKWIRENIKLNVPYVVFGKTNWFNGTFSMPHPEMELLLEHEKGLQVTMQPVYPSTEKLAKAGVSNKLIGKMLQQLFMETKADFPETLSAPICRDLKLLPRADALLNIHFPKNQTLLAKAQFRLKFEELFLYPITTFGKEPAAQTKNKRLPL